MKVCPNCGNEVPDKARLCAHCSTPLLEAEEPHAPPPLPTPQMHAEAQVQSQQGQPMQPPPGQPAQPQPGPVAARPVHGDPGPQVIVRKTEGKAVASLVCGLVGVIVCPIFVLSIIAIVLSRQAKTAIKASGGALEGEGLVTAGLITGIIGLVWSTIQTVALILIFTSGDFLY